MAEMAEMAESRETECKTLRDKLVYQYSANHSLSTATSECMQYNEFSKYTSFQVQPVTSNHINLMLHHQLAMHAIKFAHYSYYCQQLQDISMTQQEMDPFWVTIQGNISAYFGCKQHYMKPIMICVSCIMNGTLVGNSIPQ